MMKYISNNHVRRKHGLSKKPEYKAWHNMIYRCYNPECRIYEDYGARGIQVCDRWKYSVETFVKDVGSKPDPKLTLERINNDGNYEPGNCKWATRAEQTWNTRRMQRKRIKLIWDNPPAKKAALKGPDLFA
jgi:hypothetical protein